MLAALAPYATELCRSRIWPDTRLLQEVIAVRGITNQRGIPIRLVNAAGHSQSYEERVYLCGELEVRQEDWHDFFNVLAWFAYPRTKAALNARHVSALAHERAGAAGIPRASRSPNRGPVRDALTLFDESGAVVISSDRELIEDLRAFRWKKLFWDARQRVSSAMRFHVLGHAVLAKALSPYIGMTAHAITFHEGASVIQLPVEQQMLHVDQKVAEYVSECGHMTTPHALAPLPLLGVPGWCLDSEAAAFYDNTRYFRRARSRHTQLLEQRRP